MEESYLTFDSYLTFFFSVGVLSLRDLKTFFVCCLLFFKLLNNIYYVFLILFVAQSIFIIQKQNKKEMIQHIWKMSNFLRVHSCFFLSEIKLKWLTFVQLELKIVAVVDVRLFSVLKSSLCCCFKFEEKKHTQKEMNHRWDLRKKKNVN